MEKLKLTKKYENYPEYKDSGVEWFGKVPKDWQVGPLRSVLTERVEKNKKLVSDNILSVMKDVGVIRYADKGDIGNKSSDRPENYKIVHAGDIVLNSMNLVIGSVGQSKELGVTSSVYIIYYPRSNEIFADYYHYLFRNKSWQKTLGRLGKGIMELRESINSDLLKIEPVPIPPLNQQKKIVSFLNEKTSYIDQIIERKQKQIELLREKRIALINNAVTRGFDSKAELVESGIEWIRKIPKGWKIKPFRVLFRERFEKNINMECKNLFSLSYGKIINKDINSSGGLLPESFSTYQIVKKGDLVFRLTDLQNDKKSLRVGYVDSSEEGIITSAYLAVVALGINKKYAYYLFYAYDLLKVYYGMGGGVRQTLDFDDFKYLPIILPTVDEQEGISNYLDSRCSFSDKLINDTKTSIELLQEFKSSLISNVVTGKIKVD